jgi:hypothetical protein
LREAAFERLIFTARGLISLIAARRGIGDLTLVASRRSGFQKCPLMPKVGCHRAGDVLDAEVIARQETWKRV